MQWFQNLNAAPRLLSSFGLLIVLTLGIGWLSISRLGESDGRFEILYTRDMTAAQQSNDLAKDRLIIERLGAEAVLHARDPDIVAANEKATRDEFAKMHTDLNGMTKNFFTPSGKEIIAGLHKNLTPYEKAYGDLYSRIHAGDAAGAVEVLKTAAPLSKAMGELGDRAILQKVKRGKTSFDENKRAFSSARTLILVGAFLCAALGISLAFAIAKGFSRPLSKTVSALEQLAEGDLTTALDISSKDEMGRMGEAFNKAVVKLHSTMHEVAENAAQANSSSQQLAAAAAAIALGAQQQAASLEETSASLEQITATVRQSADNARQASQLASGSRDTAEQGQEVVSSAIAAMDEINAASAKISAILSTINEIAFQTNLLAVNAAVEAARAGEQGRGFAVVAGEVGSLAQRSASAAKEIKVLIQDSLQKVETGSAYVNRSGETLQGIVGSVKRVTDIVGEIAVSASEQSIGVEQVNTAVTQMDHVTQSNSAQTEELSATAQTLSHQAARLQEVVGMFTLRGMPGGGASGPSIQPQPAAQHVARHTGFVPAKRPGAGPSRPGSAARSRKPKVIRQPGMVMATAESGNSENFEEF